MPLIDMAEAVIRGDIIVDEVDALNKYAERFVDGRDQAFRGTERLPNLPMPSMIANNEGSETFSWNQVLVDEVDLVRAAGNGRSDIAVPVLIGSHQADVAGPASINDVVAEGGDDTVWNRSLLVDEVDFLNAFEHGKIGSDNLNIMRLGYDNRVRRSELSVVENEEGVEAETAESDNEVIVDNDGSDVISNDSLDEDDSDDKNDDFNGDVSNHPIVNA